MEHNVTFYCKSKFHRFYGESGLLATIPGAMSLSVEELLSYWPETAKNYNMDPDRYEVLHIDIKMGGKDNE